MAKPAVAAVAFAEDLRVVSVGRPRDARHTRARQLTGRGLAVGSPAPYIARQCRHGRRPAGGACRRVARGSGEGGPACRARKRSAGARGNATALRGRAGRPPGYAYTPGIRQAPGGLLVLVAAMDGDDAAREVVVATA